MNEQLDFKQRSLPFGGSTFDREKDGKRLTNYFYEIKKLMLTGKWFTLRELCEATGCLETSASARVRDLRKKWAGGYTIERRRIKESGLFQYRVKLT